MPKRIQRRRTKGWRLPPNTKCVTRPGVFGNPWTHAKTLASGPFCPDAIAQVNVNEFRGWLEADEEKESQFPLYVSLRERKRKLLERLSELRGKDLACYCPLDRPCHADVLLDLANR